MGEWLRWMVALTVYPFLLIDDLWHHEAKERFLREQRERFFRQHEGE